jgi:carboxypeptidase C (cathepsin A)
MIAGMLPGRAVAQEKDAEKKDEAKEEGEKKKDEEEEKKDEEKISETSGSITVAGEKVAYLAKAGTLKLKKEDGTPRASVFYVAYEREGVNDKAQRPLVFCFNGGPGSSAVWLHIGALGPKRVDLGSAAGVDAPAPPFRLVDNEWSLLGAADLVFIDPVSTGYSRPEKPEQGKEFHGFQEDLDGVAEFIRLYVTQNERWDSPKFLAGESYGAIRASGLAEVLQSRFGMYLNGVMLISGVLDFRTLSGDSSNELPYVVFLPSMAAVAHYHGKLDPELQKDLAATVKEVEIFALGEYATALTKGGAMTPGERAAIVKKIARYTGLSERFVDENDLRVDATAFRKELLREEGETFGRFDGRVKGRDSVRAGSSPEYDPSYNVVYGAFASAMNAYLREDLGYKTDLPYEILTGKVHPWNYNQFTNRYVTVANHIGEALQTNGHLRFFVACGYHDLATPSLAIRYTIDHLPMDPIFRKNFELGFYDGGHMMYTNLPSMKKLHEDLARFVRESSGKAK